MSVPSQDDLTSLVGNKVSANEFTSMLKRLRQGDSGLVPVLIGLLALVVYFDVRSATFLSAGNLTNLFIQATIFILLGMAEVWLLLLGEIDLSLGYVAGIGGAASTVLTGVTFHWSWFFALPLGLLITSFIGWMSGALVVYLRLPSFIVTLAGLLGYEGVLIYIIDKENSGGTVPVQEKVLYDLVNGNLTTVWTWIVISALVLVAAIVMLRGYFSRRSSGLVYRSIYFTVAKIVALAVAGVVLALIFNTDRSTFSVIRGMPFAIPIDIAMLLGGTFILTKTKAGRYIYAIGGNKEAARRAGINVNRYRLMAFTLGGFTAGVAGLLYSSWLGGMSDAMPGGTLVLYAVAAAVIGGTSLFGGRGKMIHAVIGGMVIATIYNGMALLTVSTAVEYIVTALVLLAAVTVDSLARRGNSNPS
ncbi:MAG: sugar ABC transporter permease [Acidimicrobiales bacterium]